MSKDDLSPLGDRQFSIEDLFRLLGDHEASFSLEGFPGSEGTHITELVCSVGTYGLSGAACTREPSQDEVSSDPAAPVLGLSPTTEDSQCPSHTSLATGVAVVVFAMQRPGWPASFEAFFSRGDCHRRLTGRMKSDPLRQTCGSGVVRGGSVPAFLFLL